MEIHRDCLGILAENREYALNFDESDVWGEADKCIKLKNSEGTQSLEKQILVFINTVNAVLTDPKLSKGAKEELRASEWELLDYCVWDNEWKNKGNSAMEWFDQWMFAYNYELR